MSGPHELGGRKLGPVPIERNEPVFHRDWERTVFGAVISTIIKGAYNVDEFRSGIEQMFRDDYIDAGYYEKWLYTLEYNLRRAGVVNEAELDARRIELDRNPDTARPQRDDQELLGTIEWLIPNGASSRRVATRAPRFKPGDRVCGRHVTPAPHTRIPEYCKGKIGTVQRVHDAYPLPDAAVRREPEIVEHVYAVRFAARDLWPDAEPGCSVLVDLWESYLDAAA